MHPSRRSFLTSSTASLLACAAGARTAHAQSGANPSAPFATQPWRGGRLDAGAYRVERVEIPSGGQAMVGNLFVPGGTGRHPAVAVLGPVAFVKEQSPVQYASRLVREGLAVLVFDPRFHGESPGDPRRWESRRAKVEDLQAAVAFMATHPALDAGRLSLLGICQGVNWAVEAAAGEPRVRSVALVAGHYLMPETAALYLGGEANVAARLERARQARRAYESTGEVQYIPIVSLTDPDALLTARPIHDFYYRWADRGPFAAHTGLWENRIARMSEEDIWGHRVDTQLERLTKPALMVHSNRAASGEAIPKRLFERIASTDKRQVWLEDRNQIQFYQDPITLDAVTTHLAAFFRRAGA